MQKMICDSFWNRFSWFGVSQSFGNFLARFLTVANKKLCVNYLNSGRRAFLTLQLYNQIYSIKNVTQQKNQNERG